MALLSVAPGSTPTQNRFTFMMMGWWGASVRDSSANASAHGMFSRATWHPGLRRRARSDKTGKFARNWTSEMDRHIPMTVKGRMFMPMGDRSFRALAGV
jgi:hypothetical protein